MTTPQQEQYRRQAIIEARRSWIKALPRPTCWCGRRGTHVVVNRFNAESAPMCLAHAKAANKE